MTTTHVIVRVTAPTPGAVPVVGQITQGPPGPGVPPGGAAGQIPVKRSDADFDTVWMDVELAGGAAWGGIVGDITLQADLVAALAAKLDVDAPPVVSADDGQSIEIRDDGLYAPGNLLSTNW